MLNIDKPGKNQSRYVVNSIQNYATKLAANSLLSISEYKDAIRSKFGNKVAGAMNNSKYSYLNFYLPKYILNHKESWKSDFLLKNVGQGKTKMLYPEIKSLDELENVMQIAGIPPMNRRGIRNKWKVANDKNNTGDLDDNIDIDDYK